MLNEERLKKIKAEQEKEDIVVNKCCLKELLRICEDMCWILEEINNIQYLRKDLKSAIEPILEKYKKVYPKTYKCN